MPCTLSATKLIKGEKARPGVREQTILNCGPGPHDRVLVNTVTHRSFETIDVLRPKPGPLPDMDAAVASASAKAVEQLNKVSLDLIADVSQAPAHKLIIFVQKPAAKKSTGAPGANGKSSKPASRKRRRAVEREV